MAMTHPVADEEQEIDMALRAAAYGRWVELREQRKPGDAERHDWIRASLMGEELRSLDSDVSRVDRIAQTLVPKGVDRWAKERKFFEGLDKLRQNLDEIAKTDFRQDEGGLAEGIKRRPRR
jgi:hypothetical protein